MNTDIINTSIEIKLDENGRPSTEPSDVIKMGQQMLTKSLLEKTENGTRLPGDMGEISQIIRDLSNAALLSRKINVDAGKESTAKDAEELAMAHRKLRENRQRGLPPVQPVASLHVLDSIEPPPATLGEGEGLQGQQIQIPEDFIQT